jgi:hypothetical protein
MYFLISLARVFTFLLAAMVLDHYVAICSPLQYCTTITPQLCEGLVALTWVGSSFISLDHTLLISTLTFFSSAWEISHFHCDSHLLMKMACSNNLSIRVCSWGLWSYSWPPTCSSWSPTSTWLWLSSRFHLSKVGTRHFPHVAPTCP